MPIWRYLDLARLVSLLRTKALWFARADTLDDPHGGALNQTTIAIRPTEWPEMPARPGFDVAKMLAQVYANQAELRRMTIGQTFVSCWHMSPTESMAMWSIYAASRQGVAVRSTYERLCEAFRSDDPTHVGTVTYIDPDSHPVPDTNSVLTPFTYKRSAFEYERELRAVVLGVGPAEDGTLPPFSNPGPPGLPIPVDLEHLIVEVVVAPGVQQWIVDVVTDVVSAFAPGIRVRRSSLDVEPVY